MVGQPAHAAGWKLHLSVTVNDVDALFKRALPCLVQHRARFKIAAERDTIVQLNAGSLGEAQIGKVVTVYPRDDAQALALAHELIPHTRGLSGPRVVTDLHLGAAVYARYGSVRPRVTYDRLGEASELIPDGSGNWVPDLRSVPFSCPPGITIPFATASAAEVPVPPGAQRLLAGRYFVTDVLRPGLAGSVLRAIDVGNPRKPSACVLKQARPYCSEDALGRDRRVRLRHEGEVLARLRGLRGIAPAGRYFEEQDAAYLPIAYVPGRSLGTLVYQLVTGRPWQSVYASTRRRLLRYASQLVVRLRAAHRRGVLHRDIAPANVWIGDDDEVYLLDWECAHVLGSRLAPFQLGTPGFSDLSRGSRPPTHTDDWRACERVLAFMLTGLDPAALVGAEPRELAAQLAELSGLRDAQLIRLLSHTLADAPAADLDAATLLRAIRSLAQGRVPRARRAAKPLFTASLHESVLAQGLAIVTAALHTQLATLRAQHAARAATLIDAHSGVAGLLYVLACAHGARVTRLDGALARRTLRVLTAPTPVMPDLPGLMHGSAGRALAVAAAVQAGCVAADDSLHAWLGQALGGRLDWPDLTHGAAGQGFAALACARRLGTPELAAAAAACAAHLLRTQETDGGFTLPAGAPGASGERFTGFAHGAAGMMAFLASYGAFARDDSANTAWRRVEAWLIDRARRHRGGWQWPQSDSRPAPFASWCHGAPGIALGWLCVAKAQGITAVAEEYLRGALGAAPRKLRSDSLGQCHGLAGQGEIYLEARRVLAEECWQERAADTARVLLALFRGRRQPPWHYLPAEPASGADGLMLGTAGIVHFLLRFHRPEAVTSPPLLT